MSSTIQHVPATRTFHWVSSVNGDPDALSSLHDAMIQFYSSQDERETYQGMIENIDETPKQDSSTVVLARHVTIVAPEHVVEVGCASGRLYRTLRRIGFDGDYTGFEVADYLIAANRDRHPDAEWGTAEAYELPLPDASGDLVCSEFVIEHLVYPHRALEEMLRVVAPGGHLLLFFPDFVASGRFSSQLLGLTESRTVQGALRRRRPLDALLSLYDSRVRLPRALSNAQSIAGPFPINLRPLCLTYRDQMSPDVDAVYIASKDEVKEWAEANGHSVSFPKGTSGLYEEKAFLSIQKQGE